MKKNITKKTYNFSRNNKLINGGTVTFIDVTYCRNILFKKWIKKINSSIHNVFQICFRRYRSRNFSLKCFAHLCALHFCVVSYVFRSFGKIIFPNYHSFCLLCYEYPLGNKEKLHVCKRKRGTVDIASPPIYCRFVGNTWDKHWLSSID